VLGAFLLNTVNLETPTSSQSAFNICDDADGGTGACSGWLRGHAWRSRSSHANLSALSKTQKLNKVFLLTTQGIAGLTDRDIKLVADGGYHTVESIAYT
jgi:hypothetical protein